MVSYHFLDSIGEPPGQLKVVSSLVSYQLLDWPGDENLTFESSALASYHYISDGPTIISQPVSQTVRVGRDIVLNVVAEGVFPLSYQWQKDGIDLPAATNPTLSRLDTKTSDSGQYRVIVKNSFGTVVSRTVEILVYLPPDGAPPPLPTSQPTLRIPAASLTRKTLPRPTNFTIYPLGADIDEKRMTVVMTHGLNSTPEEWALPFAAKLLANHIDANIVVWDWHDDAKEEQLCSPIPGTTEFCWPTVPLSLTIYEGQALGAALFKELGENYAMPIHFIGHSLGTIVNAHCANYLHGDAKQKASTSYYWGRTHMTMFDEAELANFQAAFYGPHDVFLPVPIRSAWVDSYASFFGYAELFSRGEATLALLVPAPISRYHSYTYEWYARTIDTPDISPIGFRHSYEHSGLYNHPALGSVYIQKPIEEYEFFYVAPGETIPAAITDYLKEKAYSFIDKSVVIPLQEVSGTILTSGRAAFEWVEAKTAAFSKWTLRVLLHNNGIDAGVSPFRGLERAAALDVNVHVCSWIPVTLTSNVAGMSFAFRFVNARDTDHLIAGINETKVLDIDSRFLVDGTPASSGIINISQWAGQQIELFFGLVGSDSVNGSITIDDIQFYGAAQPPLSIKADGNSVVVSWPANAAHFALESSTNLSRLSRWLPVTNGIGLGAYSLSITNDARDDMRAYRLRYPALE